MIRENDVAWESALLWYLFRDRGNRYADRIIDLHTASRDDLIRLIITRQERITALEAVAAEQRAVIAALEATAARLTQRVGESLARPDAGADDAPPVRRPRCVSAQGALRRANSMRFP